MSSLLPNHLPPFDEMKDTLIEEGYEEGQPRPSRLARAFGIDGSGIDREVCKGSECSDCGHQGMDYRPFVSIEPTDRNHLTGEPSHSYRAFALCPACGFWEEF